MIDRAARNSLLDAIRRFVAGEISNLAFDQLAASIATDDLAVVEVRKATWHLYDDLSEHRLTGSWMLSAEQEEALGRCIVFLESNLEYRWPRDPLPNPLVCLVAGLLTLGLLPRYLMQRRKTAGAWEVWPFMNKADLLAARRLFSIRGGHRR